MRPWLTAPEVDIAETDLLPYKSILFEKIIEDNGVKSTIINLDLLRFAEKVRPGADVYELISQEVEKTEADWVIIDCLESSYVNTIVLTERIKKRNHDMKIVLTGLHPKTVSEKTLKNFEWIDFIIYGEEEIAVLEILEFIKGKKELDDLSNLVYKKNKKKITFNYLSGDNLPQADYSSYIKRNKEELPEKLVLELEGGRGCPHKCLFCGDHDWQGNYRRKSNEKIIEEIKNNIEKTGVREFFFGDYNFGANMDELSDFCKKVTDLSISWSCLLRIDDLTEEILNELKSSGCVGFFFGMESGDPKIQKKIGKNIDINKADSIIEHSHNIGLKNTASFIIGFPEETLSSLEKTMEKAVYYSKKGCKTELNHLIPMGNSDIFRKNKKNIYFDSLFYTRMIGEIKNNEIDLIKGYPEIFSFHYRIKNDRLSHYYLLAIYATSFLIDKFPETIASLAEKEGSVLNALKMVLNLPDKPQQMRRKDFLKVMKDLSKNPEEHFGDILFTKEIKNNFIKDLTFKNL